MVIFKKKKEETMKDIKEVKAALEESKDEPKDEEFVLLPVPEKKEPAEKIEKPIEKKVEKPVSSVPLFVKIDKYKDILDIMNDIKTIIFLAKNTLSIQKQIETLVDENRRLIEDAVKKIDERIGMLDTEITKPGAYEKIKHEKYVPGPSFDHLNSVVEDLKKQIDSLKSDLNNIN